MRIFTERMFVYNYRLYDYYRRPIASLAVLADEQEDWRTHYFGYQALGSTLFFRFPVANDAVASGIILPTVAGNRNHRGE